MACVTKWSERTRCAEELAAMVRILRARMVRVYGHEDALDTCGTGGSGLERINTSTLAAFVLATEGVKVAKHGNKAASGRCGSFDVLEAVGCEIELGPEQVQHTLDELGLGFMYARLYHPAMTHVVQARQFMGVRTVFNLLGPLMSPALVRRQVLGVSDGTMAKTIVEVLRLLGHERALVVHGHDGLDEVTLTGPTTIFDLDGSYEVTPESMGLFSVPFERIAGGGVSENARDFLAILKGEDVGPKRDLVLMNVAAGLMVAERVSDFKEGVNVAVASLESGSAYALFKQYRDLTRSL